ncbi:MAG: GNAT family N-acetyltransferase [Lysinibacillus sp.]
MSIEIRKAVLEDAEGIAKVHVESWRTTYSGIMKDSIIAGLDVGKRTELWKNNMAREGNIVLVAVKGGQIIGFACGSAVREGEYPEYDGDVTSIYFYQEEQGNGYGKLLLDALFHEFRQAGFGNAIVKVLDQNDSRYFYERLGAKLIDSQEVPQYGEGLNLLIYAWDNLQSPA